MARSVSVPQSASGFSWEWACLIAQRFGIVLAVPFQFPARDLRVEIQRLDGFRPRPRTRPGPYSPCGSGDRRSRCRCLYRHRRRRSPSSAPIPRRSRSRHRRRASRTRSRSPCRHWRDRRSRAPGAPPSPARLPSSPLPSQQRQILGTGNLAVAVLPHRPRPRPADRRACRSRRPPTRPPAPGSCCRWRAGEALPASAPPGSPPPAPPPPDPSPQGPPSAGRC